MKLGKLNLKWSQINMPELDLRKLIAHFAHSNMAEGKSPKTVTWYTEMLADFVRFLTSNGKHTALAELQVDTVREFIIHEQEIRVSPYTVQAKARALKAFSSCCALKATSPLTWSLLSSCQRHPHKNGRALNHWRN